MMEQTHQALSGALVCQASYSSGIMAKMSDPARDFTDLCLSLRSEPSNQSGADVLARKFGVRPWSTDFMLIMASIHQRIEALRQMVGETDLDDDIKATAVNCLEGIRNAFAQPGLHGSCTSVATSFLSDGNLTPVRITSGYVRINYGYFIPDNTELTEVVEDIKSLLVWLKEINIVERDFIRLALIEGLTAFLFRVERVGYFGWPDTFESLKAVVAAYMALERNMPDPNVSPPYEAVVKKTGDLLRRTFERIKFAKEVTEVGDWLLRGYGALRKRGLMAALR